MVSSGCPERFIRRGMDGPKTSASNRPTWRLCIEENEKNREKTERGNRRRSRSGGRGRYIVTDVSKATVPFSLLSCLMLSSLLVEYIITI